MSAETPETTTTHVPVRHVTSTGDLVTVTIDCLYDDFTTSHAHYIAEEASALAAAEWDIHAPDVPL